MKAFLLCLVFAVTANAWFSKPKTASYEKLYVTFKSFSRLPVTKSDVISKGWKLAQACDASNAFAGNRYMLNGDMAVMLLLDNNGLVGGIQMGASKTLVPAKKAPWVEEGNMYVITAYFRDPSTLCGASSRHQVKVYGDRLLIQNGPSISNTISIPFVEDDLKGSNWVAGACFPLMGQHYWYGISNNMNCDDFYPVFLMYNGGRLNGFGWNTEGMLTSSRYEHPPKKLLSLFFKSATQPTCLSTRPGDLTTQHVYMDWPYNNFC